MNRVTEVQCGIQKIEKLSSILVEAAIEERKGIGPIYEFPEMKLCGIAVSDLYIPRIAVGLFSRSKKGRMILEMYKSLTDTTDT